MLENVFLGNSLKEWGITLIILLCTYLLTKLITLINKKVIKKLTTKTRNNLDDILFEALESPVKFGIALIGIWIAIYHLSFQDGFTNAIDKAYRLLIVLNVTWFFSRLINGMIEGYWTKRSDNSAKTQKQTIKMMPMIKRTIVILVWIVGVVMALGNAGVNVATLIGTLGIGGIAFALAAQDTIKNIFGAFTIFTDRPFSIGDVIRIDGFEGTIVDVGIRSTKMRNYDKRLITFPNSKLTDASIVNISAEPMRRVVMKLGLTYDTSPEKMNEAINILLNIPSKVQYVSPKDIKANFSDFGDSAMIITFIYFIEKKGDISNTTSNVNMEILSSFNKAGLNFAFPSQTLYLNTDISV